MDFWDVFWLMFIYVPLVCIWGTSLVDIFHRDDLSGGGKATWLMVIFFLPFFGTLIYLMARRPGGTPEERAALDAAGREFVQQYASTSPADQVQVLAALHDRNKLTDEEFATEKRRVLASAG